MTLEEFKTKCIEISKVERSESIKGLEDFWECNIVNEDYVAWLEEVVSSEFINNDILEFIVNNRDFFINNDRDSCVGAGYYLVCESIVRNQKVLPDILRKIYNSNFSGIYIMIHNKNTPNDVLEDIIYGSGADGIYVKDAAKVLISRLAHRLGEGDYYDSKASKLKLT